MFKIWVSPFHLCVPFPIYFSVGFPKIPIHRHEKGVGTKTFGIGTRFYKGTTIDDLSSRLFTATLNSLGPWVSIQFIFPE